jgi:hypothetical protein
MLPLIGEGDGSGIPIKEDDMIRLWVIVCSDNFVEVVDENRSLVSLGPLRELGTQLITLIKDGITCGVKLKFIFVFGAGPSRENAIVGAGSRIGLPICNCC